MVWFAVTFSIKRRGGTAETAHQVMMFIVQAWQSEFDPQNISRGGGEKRLYKGVFCPPHMCCNVHIHTHTASCPNRNKSTHTSWVKRKERKSGIQGWRDAQQVTVPATKFDRHLSSIPRTNMVEGETQLQQVLSWPPRAAQTCNYKVNSKVFKNGI